MMEYRTIVELLGYAVGAERAVRITTTDHQSVVGIPTSLDQHPAALELYLRPIGDDDTEIVLGLTSIEAVELC